LCENCGGRPGLPVPNKPYSFCGRKAVGGRKTKQNKKQQQQNGKNSVRFRFGSPFSSKVMTCGHCLVTLCRFWPSDLFFYFFKTEKTLNNRSKKGINKERQGNPVRRITMPTSLQQAACLADN